MPADPVDIPGDVLELARERASAKAAKDYAEADRLREAIRERGFLITDTAAGFELAPRPPFDVLAGLAELAQSALPAARCTVIVLIDGWADDVAACLSALVRHAPSDVNVLGIDCGNIDGAGLALEDMAGRHPQVVIARHLPTALPQLGWAAAVTAAITSCTSEVVVVMDMSTILDGDGLTPILAVLDDDSVVASGWRGVDVDTDDAWRSFVDAGPGEVDAILGYLFAVRRESAIATPPHPKARFYRNADMEWSLALREAGGRLVIPDGDLPIHQERHHGYHDTDPEYRDRESKRTYDRLLTRFRGRDAILRPRG